MNHVNSNGREPPAGWRFGPFEADGATGELRKNGFRIRLQEQPARILRALLERPGEMVTRDELRDRLWPGNTFVDFERSLNAAVAKLRQVLADSAEKPRYVETVSRPGISPDCAGVANRQCGGSARVVPDFN